jgi:FkbM family methyltransferase
MHPRLKRFFDRAAKRLGYQVRPITGDKLGYNPFDDMARLTQLAGITQPPVVFDVGANVGQSITRIRETMANAIIHSFEPSPGTFKQLRQNTVGIGQLKLNNIGLGAHRGELPFLENECSDMSSFLEPGSACWGEVGQPVIVPVRTVDDYCDSEAISRIDVLKSDTQGFDLEVIKGAERMIRENRIHLIYMELTFCELYKGLPTLDEIYKHMRERDFSLVSFYRFFHQNGRAGWSDALFASDRFGLPVAQVPETSNAAVLA